MCIWVEIHIIYLMGMLISVKCFCFTYNQCGNNVNVMEAIKMNI